MKKLDHKIYQSIDECRTRHGLMQQRFRRHIKEIDKSVNLNNFQKIQFKQTFFAEIHKEAITTNQNSVKLNFSFNANDIEAMKEIPNYANVDDINAALNKRPKLRKLLQIIEIYSVFAGNGFTMISNLDLAKYANISTSTLYDALEDLKRLNLISTITSGRRPNTKFRAIRLIRANRIYIEYFKAGYRSRCKFRSHYLFIDPSWHSNSLRFDDRWLLNQTNFPSPSQLLWVYKTEHRINEQQFEMITRDFSKVVQSLKLDWQINEPYDYFRLDAPSLNDSYRNVEYPWGIKDQYLMRYYLRYHVAYGLPEPTRFMTYPWYIERELSMSRESAMRLLESKHCQSILFQEEKVTHDEDEEGLISGA